MDRSTLRRLRPLDTLGRAEGTRPTFVCSMHNAALKFVRCRLALYLSVTFGACFRAARSRAPG